MNVDDATLAAQADATDPAASAWVSANAGSGKTFVLSLRVVRLLLAGADPGRILCLTFTKAAAAQMSRRVFDRLAQWATLPDRELAAELAKLEGKRVGRDDLARARRLFARALETPGGLKIQTIHAFCERLLHQFPFEANVAGHFEVLDEREQALLAEEARRRALKRADDDPDGPLGRALRLVMEAGSDWAHEQAIKTFLADRDRLREWIVAAERLDGAIVSLRVALGLDADETAASLRAGILAESLFSGGDLSRLLEALRAGSKKDCEAAERLAPAIEATADADREAGYLAFWLTSEGDLRKTSGIVTKGIKDDWPGLAERLEAEAARLTALRDRIAAAECFESTAAMLRLADAAIAEYSRMKIERGVLDFEDLVVKSVNLLSRADAAAWVQYKLDRGLQHILVDEAQDTSPRQWRVIRYLVEEFFAGEGASPRLRTLFAVGDQKQSIFSFQGAVPAWFQRMRRELGVRARAAGLTWNDPALHVSFRSVATVLGAVDRVFAADEVHPALSEGEGPPTHSAARHREPGRVIVWPMVEPEAKVEPEDWATPLDHLGPSSPEVRLARRIADTVAGWLHRGERLDSGAPIRAGGILVLCRNRGALTDAINRALKSRRVPIAGADRLTLTEHIAVIDLVALGRVMLLPEDDLSLAALLKSPLFGVDEEALFQLAHGRGEGASLWQALAAAPDLAPVHEKLRAWRGLADQIDPHAFYARILGPERGRRDFLKRLGPEAEDVLDEFLAQALSYERTNVPSLEGFLAWLTASATEIKRDTESARDEVRVMTVHGAKGLEADVVFLVDNGSPPTHPSHDPRVVALADDRDGTAVPLVWMRRVRAMPQQVKDRIEAIRDEGYAEYLRLLYVGMTRAKDRLYVCGARKRIVDKRPGWHALVTKALEGEWTDVSATSDEPAFEWRPPPMRPAPAGGQTALALVEPLPAWLDRPVPPPAARVRVAPSAALGEEEDVAAYARGAGDGRALRRGTLIHRLLEALPGLPEAERAGAAARYLAAAAADWTASERDGLSGEVLAVLEDRRFAAAFAPGSRAEIDIAGRVPWRGRDVAVSGRIDRLSIADGRILIVDYKTNRPAPATLAAVPPVYVGQLALYRRVLAALYPGREVAAALLWTSVPALMEIPAESLEAVEPGPPPA